MPVVKVAAAGQVRIALGRGIVLISLAMLVTASSGGASSEVEEMIACIRF